MVLADTFRQAYRTVAGNRLRTGITVSIIAFGIMALIGIITAIQAMNSSVNSNFATMGANGFTLTYKEHRKFGNNNNNNDVSKETRGRMKKKSNLDK
ncbi:MAG: ABC transporter permease, partial [Bacteroidota bacterium]|nr:ABC transporter permease [Bacteroidota bacterium]